MATVSACARRRGRSLQDFLGEAKARASEAMAKRTWAEIRVSRESSPGHTEGNHVFNHCSPLRLVAWPGKDLFLFGGRVRNCFFWRSAASPPHAPSPLPLPSPNCEVAAPKGTPSSYFAIWEGEGKGGGRRHHILAGNAACLQGCFCLVLPTRLAHFPSIHDL